MEEKLLAYKNLEQEIKNQNAQLNQLRIERSKLTTDITTYLKSSNSSYVWDGSKYEYTESNQFPSLTFSYVQTCLEELIADKSQVEKIMDHLKSRRVGKTVVDFKQIKLN